MPARHLTRGLTERRGNFAGRRSALTMALAGECDDDVLRDVFVDAVEPLGGSGQLVVRIGVPPHLAVATVSQRLDARASMLRASIARTICRKRVPSLAFVLFPTAHADGGKGGGHA